MNMKLYQFLEHLTHYMIIKSSHPSKVYSGVFDSLEVVEVGTKLRSHFKIKVFPVFVY